MSNENVIFESENYVLRVQESINPEADYPVYAVVNKDYGVVEHEDVVFAQAYGACKGLQKAYLDAIADIESPDEVAEIPGNVVRLDS